ncbi:MAG: adenylate/guanylate cyclase domain-containing response regulator [Gemmataceae bacterium]|nr:adenylate/guanylate cyclase domain-containing response regulator [Gemmataceae bacterium]MDW8263932.1 adenylate/guanylate cyclase domain-containing response regulator [Gemmataceae bacterium]
MTGLTVHGVDQGLAGPDPRARPQEVVALSAPARRDLLLAVRRELLELLQAIVTYSEVLLRDAEEAQPPDDFLTDLRKMNAAAQSLLGFVAETFDPQRAEFQGDDFDASLRRLRHDVGNRLNHLTGFCQILLLREETEHFGSFTADLERIRACCQTLAQRLQRLRAAGPAPEAEPAPPLSLPTLPTVFPRDIDPGDVLIVDDNPYGRDVLRRLLEPQGHRIHEAEDGEQALATLQSQPVDVMLLDLLMPRMNGLDVLQRLQADNRMTCSVIVISGLEEIDSVARCIELGADDYLTKPIDRVLLQARLRSSLLKRRLRQRELEQFFPPKVARQMLHRPELLEQGRDAEISVLFADVRGFSRISEDLGPAKTVQWLRAVMEVLSDVVLRHQGVLVDIIGDELMAMWGAPEEQPDHADLACQAALDMLDQLPALNRDWQPIIGEPISLGIGINSGPARVGNTGTRRRLKYGALGDTVNLASRVQGATKYLMARLLITDDTRRRLRQKFHVGRVANVQAVNIDRPITLYEVHARTDRASVAVRRLYARALRLYENRRFKEAAEVLGSLLTQYGAQGPAVWLMSRTMDCLAQPGKWRKLWDLPGK